MICSFSAHMQEILRSRKCCCPLFSTQKLQIIQLWDAGFFFSFFLSFFSLFYFFFFFFFFCNSLELFQCNFFFAGVPHTQSQCCTMAWENCWYKLMDREQITGYVNCKNLDKSVCNKVIVVVTYSVLNSSNFFSTQSEY